MWTCPDCGRSFANTNQWHACGQWTIDEHFEGKPKAIREIFDRFRAMVEACGPVRQHPTSTRIGFITHMTFAAVMPLKSKLKGHLILHRRAESERFVKITGYGRDIVHEFELRSIDELDDEMAGLIAESYRVGQGE